MHPVQNWIASLTFLNTEENKDFLFIRSVSQLVQTFSGSITNSTTFQVIKTEYLHVRFQTDNANNWWFYNVYRGFNISFVLGSSFLLMFDFIVFIKYLMIK